MTSEIKLIGRGSTDDGVDYAHFWYREDGVLLRLCDGDNPFPDGSDPGAITPFDKLCKRCIDLYAQDTVVAMKTDTVPKLRIDYEVQLESDI